MSCCGPSPIITSLPPVPRVDVEGSLLCDILADGTVAGQALVEAVYDTTSGDRVGTRTVDPATGAVYAPQGTLQPCPPPDSCSCETLLLCDAATVTTPGESPERITAGDFPDAAATNAAWTRTGGASWVANDGPDGVPGFLDFSGADTPPGSISQTVTVTPGLTYAFSAHFGTWNGGGGHQQTGRIEIFDGAGNLLFTQDVAPTIGVSGIIWPADGIVGPVNIVATDGTMRLLITDTSVNPGQTDLIIDDISLLGPGTPDETTTTTTPFLRTICRTCAGTATVTDTTLDGTTTYDVQGDVGVCGPTSGEETAPPLVLGQVCYDDGTGTVRTAAAVRCAGCDDTAVTYLDVETGAEVAAPTLVDCPASEECSCETLLLCDTPAGGEQPTADATVNVTAGTPGSGAPGPGSIMGAPFNAPLTDSQAVWDGSSAVLPATADNGHTYLVGLVDLVPDCGTLDPAGSTVLNLGVRIHNDGTGAGCGLWGRFTVWANGVDVIGAPAHLGTLSGGTGIAPGATINPTRTATVSNADILAGDVYVELNVQTGADTTPDGGGCTPNDPGVGQAYTIDQFTITAEPVAVTGCLAPGDESVPFLRHICRSCAGTETVRDTTLDGTTAYDVQGTVSVCGAEPGCASPTTPVTSVGLCLADGTPIAVTVVRDCDGVVTSEGWLNLVTGAWSAGAVPAGTVACGDSRSIQVSGTFCAVDAAGEVVGLVLVEYSYDDTGAISAVRLVDATTGATYTPPAGVTITTCPTGTEQPEQDAVILCHTAADGSVTQIVRDYRRDENGAITGYADYLLDGTAYNAAGGTVGVCPQPCNDCETIQLCDVVTPNPGAEGVIIPAQDQGAGTASNGVTWSVTDSDLNGTMQLQANVQSADGTGYWYGIQIYPRESAGPHIWTFGQPSTVRFSVTQVGPGQVSLSTDVIPLHLPDGYSYDATTRTLTSTSDDCPSLATPAVATAATFLTAAPVSTLTINTPQAAPICSSVGTTRVGGLVLNPAPVPFLRTICRGCDGTVTSVSDTTLDGSTDYDVVGTASACVLASRSGGSDVVTELLCDTAGATNTYADLSTAIVPPVSHGEPPLLFQNAGFMLPASTVDNLWDPTIGLVNIPTWSSDPGGFRVNAISARVTPTGPLPCGTPTSVRVRVTLRYTNTGPTAANFPDPETTLSLRNGSTILQRFDYSGGGGNGVPINVPITATVQAVVPWADLVAGNITWYWSGYVYAAPNNRKNYRLDQYNVEITDAAPIPDCGETTPFLRHYTSDPDSQTATYFDTTLDGEPYVAGKAVLCTGEVSGTTTSGRQVIERCGCSDEDGDGIGEVRYVELWSVDPDGGGAPLLVGTYIDGDFDQPFTPAAPVDCPGDGSGPGVGTTLTGARSVTGTAPQDLATEFPGLQSVTLIVGSGTVQTSMNDGNNVPFPAGVSATWSAGDSGVLGAASFAGADAGTTYLLIWTYTA